MADLVTQRGSLAGAAITPVAAAGGGDTYTPGPNVFLHVFNGDGTSTTVTVHSYRDCDQGGSHDLAVAVPAGENRQIGPLSDGDRWVNPATGKGSVTYSKVTSLTIAAVAA